jgi:hypothetical protein
MLKFSNKYSFFLKEEDFVKENKESIEIFIFFYMEFFTFN